MKTIIKSLFLVSLLVLVSCEEIVDGINDNPNDITIEDTRPELFLTGAMLANTVAQAGHWNRIAGMYSGQLTGFTSLYSNIYGYSLSTAESVNAWSRIYVGTITNIRGIRDAASDDPLLMGITKVLEAHAVGTAASLTGDVPYSEINNVEVADPVFDSQVSVLNALIGLLDNAISDLSSASSRDIPEDIYFEGDADKWRQAANTLKARYYMHLQDYGSAYSAAQSGIASDDATMKYSPRGDAAIAEGDKNLFWTILEGSRTGDIGTGDSYLIQLLADSTDVSRHNAKTDETARSGYYVVDASGGRNNAGIIEQFEPHRLVTLEENNLILAEAGFRTSGFSTGLRHLNEHRAWLNAGGRLNSNFADMPYLYEAYEAADFDAGGMENADGLSADKALLREIIEERYVSGFGTYMPFDDARRIRKTDSDIGVPFPLNTAAASVHPERLPYSDDELTTNSNAPAEDPGIFTKTEVNR